ncbi:yabJ protein [Aspergillus varians]
MSASKQQAISTPDAPAPVASYSQAIVRNDTIYCSGMVGLDVATNTLVSGGVFEQTHQLLRNMGVILKASGSSYENVLKVNIFITTMDHFAAMNEAYKDYFTAPLPARTCVAVRELPLGALVEMECTAFK